MCVTQCMWACSSTVCTQEVMVVIISAETIIQLFDYSVGLTLFDSLTHYSNNC